MGTFTGYYSRQDVVDDLIKQYSTGGFTLIDRKATNYGRHLWFAIQPKQGPSFICLFKLSSYGGDWGYKPIDESMGPCHHECPLSLLAQVDAPTTEYSKNWRDRVLDWHGYGPPEPCFNPDQNQ